jgi:hypothetical protein
MNRSCGLVSDALTRTENTGSARAIDASMLPARRRGRELTLLQAPAFDTPRARSKSTREKQYNENDQDNADGTDATVTIAVAVAAEAATEATKQEDDEDDDKYGSERHDLSPVEARD